MVISRSSRGLAPKIFLSVQIQNKKPRIPTADIVQISINVTQFRDIRNLSDPGRFCDIAALAITDPNARLIKFAGDPKTVHLNNGKGGGAGPSKPVQLEFTVANLDAQGAPMYSITGFFFNTADVDDGTSGRGNFKIVKLADNVLTLANKHSAGNGRKYWELFIAIQNSSGAPGLIDPGVENSEDA